MAKPGGCYSLISFYKGSREGSESFSDLLGLQGQGKVILGFQLRLHTITALSLLYWRMRSEFYTAGAPTTLCEGGTQCVPDDLMDQYAIIFLRIIQYFMVVIILIMTKTFHDIF